MKCQKLKLALDPQAININAKFRQIWQERHQFIIFKILFYSEILWLLKALFNREVDCIDCELIPVTVTSCEFEPFDQDDAVTGKTTAIVKSRDLNELSKEFNR